MGNVRSLQSGYYEALRRLTLEIAGVKLGADTDFLVETRLSVLARQEGYDDLESLISELFTDGNTRLAVHVVSALLERDIRFFDDKDSFKSLSTTIWPLLSSAFDDEEIRILCYGCDTGQDAYSLGMTLCDIEESFPHLAPRKGFHITAVDYPSRALSRATSGRFTHFDVQRGLPARRLIKYMTRSGEDWVITPALRDRMEFREFHLLSDPKGLGTYHMVVMRNALARYAPAAQMRILRSLGPTVKTGGYLMLGSGENLNELNFGLDAVEKCPGFFKRRATRFSEDAPTLSGAPAPVREAG